MSPHDPPLTDFHIHVQPWEMMHEAPRETLSRRASAEVRRAMREPAAALALMDEAGVDRAVLVNYVAPEVMGFTAAVNDWVLAYAAAAPDRLLACGGVDLYRDPDPAATVRRLVEDGIRVLKIHPPHSLYHADAYRRGPEGTWEGMAGEERRRAAEGMGRLYEACEDAGLPVMVHTGTSVFPGARNRFGDPLDCDDVCVDFPGLRLVLAHAGRPFWCPQAVFLARRHPNLHLDLSGIPPLRLPHYLPDLERISQKCLWGTDWPAMGVPGMGRNLEDFRSLSLTPEACEAILRRNAARLLDSAPR